MRFKGWAHRRRPPSTVRQRMLPFQERTTRHQKLFKRWILIATLAVLAGMIGIAPGA